MTGWTAIVPVKPWRLGKSRLPPRLRVALAEAFALDTLDVLTSSASVARVLVVSTEPGLDGPARAAGATLVRDPGPGGHADLSAALGCGLDWASSSHPTEPVVVVPADLACLTSTVLEQVLDRAVGSSAAFVPDARGDGTTLLMAGRPDLLPIAYGPASAAQHRSRGARRLSWVDPRARRDVDTVADLEAAIGLGIGPRSAEAVRRSELAMTTLARY